MDIVTHAGIGVIAAAPFVAERPELAIGLVAGSVLPDLDAFYRLIDKRSFLQSHQTWSHALPIQILFSIIAGIGAHFAGWNALALSAGLFAGLSGHTFLDLTNTFGVALFSTHLLCRDMRTRNFGTRFGDLEVWLDADHRITKSEFHV